MTQFNSPKTGAGISINDTVNSLTVINTASAGVTQTMDVGFFTDSAFLLNFNPKNPYAGMTWAFDWWLTCTTTAVRTFTLNFLLDADGIAGQNLLTRTVASRTGTNFGVKVSGVLTFRNVNNIWLSVSSDFGGIIDHGDSGSTNVSVQNVLPSGATENVISHFYMSASCSLVAATENLRQRQALYRQLV